MLVKARESVGVGKSEMCRRTGFTFGQLRLLEVKPNNFAMDKPLHYLNCIEMALYLDKENGSVTFNNATSIGAWLKDARKGIYSQYSLAAVTGCTYQTIANIERGSNTVAIDNFLKLADILGYTIKIEPK